VSANEERRAILGLALASRPNEEEVRAEVFRKRGKEEPPTLTESLAILAERTDVRARSGVTADDARVSNRVLHLDLLAKVAIRRPEVLPPSGDGTLEMLAQAAVAEADRVEADGELSDDEVTGEDVTGDAVMDGEPPPPGPPPPEDDRVRATVNAFRNVTLLPPQVPNEHHWTRFVRLASGPLNLTDAEIRRPLCTDDERVTMPNGLVAVRTAVWFWSDRPATDFARWTDPREWAKDCHLFFKSVAPKAGTPVPTGRSFDSTLFREVVSVDGDSELSTDLVFSRTVEDPYLYATEFDLPPPPLPDGAEIVVDTGQVTVREDPLAPPARRTTCLAEKYIRFADPEFETWPTVACDTFWTEFCITMALGC
jgi:hypothetical protein